MHSPKSLSPVDSAQIKNQKKILMQCVFFHKSWYLVQFFLEDANKPNLSSKDLISVKITPRKSPKTASKEFYIPLRSFIENLRHYWQTSFSSFFQTKRFTASTIIHFILNLDKVIIIKRDQVTLSSDYIKQENDYFDFDFSFRENRALNMHEVFQDNARNKKKKNDAKKDTDHLFDKNYNEVFDKYFASKKNMVFNQNINEENNGVGGGNIKVDSDEENQNVDQPIVQTDEPAEIKDLKTKKTTESVMSEDDITGLGSSLKKWRYYISHRIPNASILYLRIEFKAASAQATDYDHMVVSGYHLLKGHLYYKQITSQRIMVSIFLFNTLQNRTFLVL